MCYRKKNNSAPGLNGISYQVYKFCPRVREVLWEILHRVWSERTIPFSWQIARIRQLAKSDDTSHPSLMRPISVLNVEGRLFFTIYQEKMASYMLKNNYIKQGVQKAFLENVAGCIEHTTLLAEAIRDARERRRAICIVWIDIANAYGSVRHNLLQFALRWYHVPTSICELMWSYYQGLCVRVCSKSWTTDLIPIGIGVPQGCTASTINFDIVFQTLLDYHTHLAGDIGYKIANTNILVSKPTYADDVGLVSSSVLSCQRSVESFKMALDWAQTLKLKISKCRSLAFRLFQQGEQTLFKKLQKTHYSNFDPLIKIGKEIIKFIGKDEVLFKYLGRKFQADMGVNLIISDISAKIKSWLQLVDKTSLTGPMKAWIVNQHLCLKVA